MNTLVELVNRDDRSHRWTANDASWDSGPIVPGRSWGHLFSFPGVYLFHDATLENWQGEIDVHP
jgi:hypothetical protein